MSSIMTHFIWNDEHGSTSSIVVDLKMSLFPIEMLWNNEKLSKETSHGVVAGAMIRIYYALRVCMCVLCVYEFL